MAQGTCSLCGAPLNRYLELCDLHYNRRRKYGDPRWQPKARLSLEERFWARVSKSDEADGCWLWTGATGVQAATGETATSRTARGKARRVIRWLIGHPGPHFSVHDVYEGWVEALRGLGEQVYTFNFGDRISAFDAALVETGDHDDEGHPGIRKMYPRETAISNAAHQILIPAFLGWPDVVLLVSAFFIPPYLLDALRGRGMKVVLLHTESPYQDDEQLERAAHADVNLLNDPVNLAAYAEIGPAAYMPHAYRPSIHYPAASPRYQWDLSFIGTGFPSRVKFFESMNLDGLAVRLAGPWLGLPEDSPLRDWTATEHEDCVPNVQTAAIYRQTRTGINFYRREAEAAHDGEGWAMGPREVEQAACGLFFARDPRPESDEILHMLPTYSGPEEAGDLIRWYVDHPAEREKRAAAAREAVAERTFSANAQTLLRMLGNG